MPASAGALAKPLTPYSFNDVPAALHGAVVAIGNFDGVHRGHQVLLETARGEARRRSVPAVVLTFEPHPRSVFRPDMPVFRLTPLAAKARLFAALGLDGMIVIPFDRTFASHTADSFVESDLLGRLAVKAAVVGYDFHFGKGREGSPEFLTAAGQRLGFGVTVIGPVSDDMAIITSTRIRDHLERGEIRAAEALLGHRWFVTGKVIPGDKRGRLLGFPTANMQLAADFRLRHGIYAVRLRRADGSVFDGVASYGRRPTFDDGPPLLEVHVIDFSGDLYGEEVTVTFIDWIRPELRFESAEALIAEMAKDLFTARTILAAPPPATELDRALSGIE